MKKFILKSCLFSVIFFGIGFVMIRGFASLSNVTSGTPLSATNWNDMVKNFFWGSGSGGIYYNGKVGIGTTSPNKSLHIKTSVGTNAELDLQSGDSPHWAIYQDESTKSLSIRNGVIRTSITTGGNLNVGGTVNAGGTLNAANGICMNGDCKTAWSQVSGTAGVVNYTGTCDLSHKGYTGIISNSYKLCNGISWTDLAPAGNYFVGAGTNADPYRLLGESSSAISVIATSCNYYNLNANTLNAGNFRGSGTCGSSKACLTDGIYLIDTDGSGGNSAFKVYCDMTNDAGGWTILGNWLTASSTNIGNYLSEAAFGTVGDNSNYRKLTNTQISTVWNSANGCSRRIRVNNNSAYTYYLNQAIGTAWPTTAVILPTYSDSSCSSSYANGNTCAGVITQGFGSCLYGSSRAYWGIKGSTSGDFGGSNPGNWMQIQVK